MADRVKSEPNSFPGLVTGAAMLGITAFVALCVGAVWWIYPSVHHVRVAPPDTFPAPRLEIAPVEDYATYFARQKALLAGGGDRTSIEDAMAAIIRTGTLDPEAAP